MSWLVTKTINYFPRNGMSILLIFSKMPVKYSSLSNYTLQGFFPPKIKTAFHKKKKERKSSCLSLKSITRVLSLQTTGRLMCDRSAAGILPVSCSHSILKIDSRRGMYQCNRPCSFMKGTCRWSWPFFNCNYAAVKQLWLHRWLLLWPTGRPGSVTAVAFAASMEVTTQEERRKASWFYYNNGFDLADPCKALRDTPRDLQTTLWESLLQIGFMDFIDA